MSDCTCVRGDDGQVRVPRSRCPQHGWADTPTPAPALTDEQMGSTPADDAQIDDDVRALVEGESMPEETAWAIIAAVIARAKREAGEEIATELEAVNPVEWALAGQYAGRDAATIARGIGATR